MGEILVANDKKDLEMSEKLLANDKKDLEMVEIIIDKKSLKGFFIDFFFTKQVFRN